VPVFQIEDELHAELEGAFGTFDDALADLRRRAALPWDQAPNRAPCTSWRTCGREYYVREYDDPSESGTLIRRVKVLTVGADGAVWAKGFDEGAQRSTAETSGGGLGSLSEEAAIRRWFADRGYDVEVNEGDGQTWVNLRRGSRLTPRYVVERDRVLALRRAMERYRDEQVPSRGPQRSEPSEAD
jgi:hypothetical protein